METILSVTLSILDFELSVTLATSNNLKIDGIFGINTEKAVKKFQNNRNLKVDGIVGKKTWSYLIKGIKV